MITKKITAAPAAKKLTTTNKIRLSTSASETTSRTAPALDAPSWSISRVTAATFSPELSLPFHRETLSFPVMALV